MNEQLNSVTVGEGSVGFLNRWAHNSSGFLTGLDGSTPTETEACVWDICAGPCTRNNVMMPGSAIHIYDKIMTDRIRACLPSGCD